MRNVVIISNHKEKKTGKDGVYEMLFFALFLLLFLYFTASWPRYNYNNDRMSSVKKKQMGESSVIVGGLNRL